MLIGTDQKEGVDKVSTKEEYDQAVGSIIANCKKVQELYHLHEISCEDWILSVDHKSATVKIAFCFIKSCTEEYPEWNCHMAWMCLIAKCMPRLAP